MPTEQGYVCTVVIALHVPLPMLVAIDATLMSLLHLRAQPD